MKSNILGSVLVLVLGGTLVFGANAQVNYNDPKQANPTNDPNVAAGLQNHTRNNPTADPDIAAGYARNQQEYQDRQNRANPANTTPTSVQNRNDIYRSRTREIQDAPGN
jgi:hypothetical protein